MSTKIESYTDRITLKNMRFWGYMGVYNYEREEGQEFAVDLILGFNHIDGTKSDRLEDTVDYGQVYSVVKKIVEGENFHLIEAVAQAVVKEIFSHFDRIDAVEVTVQKPDAPIEGQFDYMAVSLFRKRSE